MVSTTGDVNTEKKRLNVATQHASVHSMMGQLKEANWKKSSIVHEEGIDVLQKQFDDLLKKYTHKTHLYYSKYTELSEEETKRRKEEYLKQLWVFQNLPVVRANLRLKLKAMRLDWNNTKDKINDQYAAALDHYNRVEAAWKGEKEKTQKKLKEKNRHLSLDDNEQTIEDIQ